MASDKAIVIIPGIAGSELFLASDNKKVWIDVPDVISGKMDCSQNGVSKHVLKPYDNKFGTLDTYKLLYNSIYNTYIEDYDEIFFAYDWLLSCSGAALHLAHRLADYKSVILIAHSMGGLVACKYLANGPKNKEKVKKFIAIGTPFNGAPKVIQTLETGEFLNGFIGLVSSSVFKDIAVNLPAVFELIPTAMYNNDYRYGFIKLGGNSFPNYTSEYQFLLERAWAKNAYNSTKPMMYNALAFHGSLYDSGKHIAEDKTLNVYKLIGTDVHTIINVQYTEDAGGHHEFSLTETGNGDGTVPVFSAANGRVNFDNRTDRVRRDRVITFPYTTHTGLVKNHKVIDTIMNIIDESVPASIYPTSTYDEFGFEENAAVKVINLIIWHHDNIDIKMGDMEVKKSEDKLYITNRNGYDVIIGSMWQLTQHSKQYILNDNDYQIEILNDDENRTYNVEVHYLSGGSYMKVIRFLNLTQTGIFVNIFNSSLKIADITDSAGNVVIVNPSNET